MHVIYIYIYTCAWVLTVLTVCNKRHGHFSTNQLSRIPRLSCLFFSPSSCLAGFPRRSFKFQKARFFSLSLRPERSSRLSVQFSPSARPTDARAIRRIMMRASVVFVFSLPPSPPFLYPFFRRFYSARSCFFVL